jgi:integrase
MARNPLDRNIWKSPGGMLYFKIGIPPELQRHFLSDTGRPKSKITETLGTDSMQQARLLRNERLAHWQRVFARLAAGAALTAEEMAGEQHRIRSSTLQAWQTMLAAPPEPMLPEVSRMIEAVRTGIAAQAGADRPAILAEVRAEARRIADEKFGPGIITEGMPQWDEICRLVASTKAKAIEDHLFGLLRGTAPVEPSAVLPVAPAANGNVEPFRVTLAHFIRWQRKNRRNRRKTVWDYLTKGKRFAKFVKNAPLSLITLDMAQRYLDDVAKDAGAATVNLHHGLCRAVFEHARNERHVFSREYVNPFSFKRRKAVKNHKAKFTVEELNALFASPVFTGRQIKPKKYKPTTAVPWAAAIALYSGATLEEIAQLRPCDIRKEKGDGLVIDITPDAAVSGRLKREARRRIAPLHPQLEALGLLKYLAALPRNAQRVFPDLTIGGKGKDHLGAALGKAFRRWRESVGIVSTPGRKLDFHSFRHTFGKAIEDAGITAADCSRLLGHKVAGISSSVYSGPELSRVAPLVAKVAWQGLRIK